MPPGKINGTMHGINHHQFHFFVFIEGLIMRVFSPFTTPLIYLKYGQRALNNKKFNTFQNRLRTCNVLWFAVHLIGYYSANIIPVACMVTPVGLIESYWAEIFIMVVVLSSS
jgi:hypothetical protein